MLTEAQITAGTARLVAGKLTAVDVDQASSILSMDTFFGGLIAKYGYDFKTKLALFDDSGNTNKTAAQIAACLIKMEELTFGVASKQGGPSAVWYKEKDEYWQYVQIIFLKMYELPFELSKFSLARRESLRRSNTVMSSRVEPRDMDIGSERSFRRRSW